MRISSLRHLAAGLAGALLVAAVPGTARANDVYTDYLDFAAAGPMTSSITLEQAMALGVGFSPMGTTGSGTLFFDLMAGESISISFGPGLSAFGFDYTSTMDLTASGSCHDSDGQPCVLSGSGFYGTRVDPFFEAVVGADLSAFDPNTLIAQGDGRIELSNFRILQQTTTVPEPATVLLLGSGIAALGGFGVARRRRERASA
jgi:hypothetical protein